jgi:hypothetical protein
MSRTAWPTPSESPGAASSSPMTRIAWGVGPPLLPAECAQAAVLVLRRLGGPLPRRQAAAQVICDGFPVLPAISR